MQPQSSHTPNTLGSINQVLPSPVSSCWAVLPSLSHLRRDLVLFRNQPRFPSQRAPARSTGRHRRRSRCRQPGARTAPSAASPLGHAVCPSSQPLERSPQKLRSRLLRHPPSPPVCTAPCRPSSPCSGDVAVATGTTAAFGRTRQVNPPSQKGAAQREPRTSRCDMPRAGAERC